MVVKIQFVVFWDVFCPEDIYNRFLQKAATYQTTWYKIPEDNNFSFHSV